VSAPVFIADRALVASAEPGSSVVLSGPEGRHAVTVLRLRTGEEVDLVDGLGRRVRGIVQAVATPDSLAVEVRSVTDEPMPSPRFSVAQAIAKGEHAELAIDLMTQLGVDTIVPWQATRSVARWSGEKIDRQRRKWRDAAVQAAKQSRRAWIPQIEGPVDLLGLAELVRGASSAILLHEAARWSFLDVPLPRSGEVLIIVGPEGGVSDEERSALIDAGAREAVLGPMVLRSSLAGAAALAVLASRLRWGAPDMEGSGS